MERIEYLRQKASELPLTPGVYIMKNSGGKIIYIGKSKALKNRVSSYFAAGEQKRHSVKTAKMVSMVADFDFMLTDTEIEALALENKLIKLHQPKYNIKLKDGKSYPYIKIEQVDGYPVISVTRKRSNDKGRYFGPYSGMGYAYEILETVRRVFALPTCKYIFPRDVGKVRPCIYHQIKQCAAPCNGSITVEELNEIYDKVSKFLKGGIRSVKAELTEKMMEAAEDMRYELAALWRDRIASLDKLLDKQKVVLAPGSEYDAISLYRGEISSCLAVGQIRDGVMVDTDYTILSGDVIVDDDSVSSAICALYKMKEYIPAEIVLDFFPGDDELSLLSDFFSNVRGSKVEVRFAQKGEKHQICRLIREGSVLRTAKHDEEMSHDDSTLVSLAKCAGLEVVPERIEAIDISNYASEVITAGIVSYKNGKPDKSGYRVYHIRDTAIQDDYASMTEAIRRRISHAEEQPLPDLLLLDGGKGHVNTVKMLLDELGVYLPVLGMVKDSYHKTRTLTDGENEISIAGEGAVFSLIYKIQEEVHRFTVSRMRAKKTNKMLKSQLTDIEGIGPKKAALLMGHFKSIQNISYATAEEISSVKGISQSDGIKISEYFKNKKEGKSK